MAKRMVFTRMEEDDIEALDNAAESMKETTRSRLVRVIIKDWLEKFAPKNNFK